MTYYIIESGHIQDSTEDEGTALYSAKECAQLSGKDVEIVQTVITIHGGKQ